MNFPFGTGEPFLFNEILILAQSFEKVYIYPMYDIDKVSNYKLPVNVEVVKFDLFQPYNRLKVIFTNLGLIAISYGIELLNSKSFWKHFIYFKKAINEITHKIAMAKKFEKSLSEQNQKLNIAYTYWFNQWTFILSIIHKHDPTFKLFTRIHGSDVYEEQHNENNFFFKFRGFQINEIKNVLAISNNGSKHLQKENNFARNKIVLSRLGTNDYGSNTYIKQNTFRIVSCSAFQAYKRVDLINHIVSLLKEKVEWVHFGDGDLRNEILVLTKKLPLNVSFKWMGFKDNAFVMDYYKSNSVDLFINVSSSEGIPVSIMEAISFGIPVIATNVGGVSEIVKEQTGYLIEKNFDVKEISLIIENHFRKSEMEIVDLRMKAKAFWLMNYCANKNYVNLVKQLSVE